MQDLQHGEMILDLKLILKDKLKHIIKEEVFVGVFQQVGTHPMFCGLLKQRTTAK